MKLHIRNIKSGKISRLEKTDCREKSFLKITKNDIKPFPQTAGSSSLEEARKHTKSRLNDDTGTVDRDKFECVRSRDQRLSGHKCTFLVTLNSQLRRPLLRVTNVTHRQTRGSTLMQIRMSKVIVSCVIKSESTSC